MGRLSRSSRQFLNLIVGERSDPGVKSLRRLKCHQFFYPGNTSPPPSTTTAPAISAADAGSGSATERIRLPRPRFAFESAAAEGQGWWISCFPLADRKVACTDQYGRTFLFDDDTGHVVTMPTVHDPDDPSMLVSLFVPGAGGEGGSLFMMDMVPQPYRTQVGVKALVYRKANANSPTKSWHCERVQQPPYSDDPAFWNRRSRITSYGVVGGGSHVCISVEGEGTYSLDTAKHTWSRVGEWTLPFRGKVEYVPEHKLWFGFCAESGHLAAADLSTMDMINSQQPLLLHSWKEFNPPEDWKTRQNGQIVNLGAGRLCVARFFWRDVYIWDSEPLGEQDFDVLTGVEVVPRVNDGGDANGSSAAGNGSDRKVQLQMIPHKSKWYSSPHRTIEELF